MMDATYTIIPHHIIDSPAARTLAPGPLAVLYEFLRLWQKATRNGRHESTYSVQFAWTGSALDIRRQTWNAYRDELIEKRLITPTHKKLGRFQIGALDYTPTPEESARLKKREHEKMERRRETLAFRSRGRKTSPATRVRKTSPATRVRKTDPGSAGNGTPENTQNVPSNQGTENGPITIHQYVEKKGGRRSERSRARENAQPQHIGNFIENVVTGNDARLPEPVRQIVEVTRDPSFAIPGHRRRIARIFETEGGAAELQDLIQRIVNGHDAAGEPIEHPAKYASAELKRLELLYLGTPTGQKEPFDVSV